MSLLTASSVLWSGFAQLVWAGIIVGLVILVATYFVVERGLKLRERRAARRELVHTTLGELRGELEFNIGQANTFVEGAQTLEDLALPVPLFNVNGWDFIQQADVFTALDRETIPLLTMTYNRLRIANHRYAEVYDLFFGPTALLVMTLTRTAAQLESFNQHRKTQLATLVGRVKELIPVTQDALDAVKRLLETDSRNIS